MRAVAVPIVVAGLLAIVACGGNSSNDDSYGVEVRVADTPVEAIRFDADGDGAYTAAAAVTVFGQPSLEMTFKREFKRVISVTAWKVNGSCHEIFVSCGLPVTGGNILWPWERLDDAPERNELPFEASGRQVTLVSSLTSGTQVLVVKLEVDGVKVSYGMLLNYLPVEG